MGTEREIDAQLDALRRVLVAVDEKELDAFVAAVDAARTAFVAGAGRTMRVMEAFATRLVQLGIKAHVAASPTAPPAGKGALVVVASASGTTAGPLAIARAGHGAGARLCAITADRRSPLWRLADEKLHVDASPASGAGRVHPLGSLFEESLFLLTDIAVARLMKHRGVSPRKMLSRHANLE